MTIEGDYALFAHLETVYLGCLARRTLIMRNVREVVEAARGQADPVLPGAPRPLARADGDGWAAHVAGAIGVSTDAQASWWGGRGVGTVPHGLIAAYGGDTVAAARAFADRYAAEMNVTVLVDFDNDSVATALEVADALGPRLGRAPGHVRPAGRPLAPALHGDDAPTGVAPELVRLTRAALDERGPPTCGSSSRAGSPQTGSGPSRRTACRRRLRRRLVADPRRERLHRRRRDGGRRAARQGRARIPAESPARAAAPRVLAACTGNTSFVGHPAAPELESSAPRRAGQRHPSRGQGSA